MRAVNALCEGKIHVYVVHIDHLSSDNVLPTLTFGKHHRFWCSVSFHFKICSNVILICSRSFTKKLFFINWSIIFHDLVITGIMQSLSLRPGTSWCAAAISVSINLCPIYLSHMNTCEVPEQDLSRIKNSEFVTVLWPSICVWLYNYVLWLLLFVVLVFFSSQWPLFSLPSLFFPACIYSVLLLCPTFLPTHCVKSEFRLFPVLFW